MEINNNYKPPKRFALSKIAIKEFQQIYFEESGKTISVENAQIEGYNLLKVFKLAMRAKEVSNG